MTMHPKQTSYVMPGCLAWILLAGVYLFTGELVKSVPAARGHPVLLVVFLASIVAASVYMAWPEGVKQTLLMLVLTLLTSMIVIFPLLAFTRDSGKTFTIHGHTYHAGVALLVVPPVLFALMMLVSTVFGLVGVTIEYMGKRSATPPPPPPPPSGDQH
jgi:hypothetical protein